MENIRIRCPKCNWEPSGSEKWTCTCGHHWNTFDTYGNCPSCGKRWEETQCPTNYFEEVNSGCGKWSKHEDWYEVPLDAQVEFGQKDCVKIFNL